ncbi:MAG: chemotaxis protein CheW, partial [Verrucomicrobiota bacterium]
AAKGQLRRHEWLLCRVRYFSDGVVIGSRGFVEGFFEARRERFGPKRRSGARKLRFGDFGGLCSLRDLRVDVVRG